jgi:hypothetical protein
MQSFIIKGETVLIKSRRLSHTAGSCRKDLNTVKLILIPRMHYKIVLYETYFNFHYQIFLQTSAAS